MHFYLRLAGMLQTRLYWLLVLVVGIIGCTGQPGADSVLNGLEPLPPGTREVQLLSPKVIEITHITSKKDAAHPPEEWNFVSGTGELRLPSKEAIIVHSGGVTLPVQDLGFKRRVTYAPLKKRDLRVGNFLYVLLLKDIPAGATIQLSTADPRLWPTNKLLTVQGDPQRLSPVIHVNQTGYLPDLPKVAVVGYYLGSLGEMEITHDEEPGFQVIDAKSGREVFRGALKPRPDQGFAGEAYQRVLEADFSDYKVTGQYRLSVPGLGISYPFRIDPDVAGAFARTYALGIYHQRCGTANELPFTRFTHNACHTGLVEVPTMAPKFKSVNQSLKQESADYKKEPRHTAPQLANVQASLYPFVNRGPLDLTGGHHDAGDYSKYTINSAGFIHHLVFAADVFPGVAELDNLGLPESGDGKSDILQEAKWEADFLAKMQDGDGGFYFLVYPRDREYENDVLPDAGDPQIVFPKNTAATAAASAALAQCASSPKFKQQFPDAAASYLEKAQQGWKFIERAIAKYGWDGSYQKITHYGNDFMHDDEITWAACELYAATGDAKYSRMVLERLKPADPEARKWGWWRLYDAWGRAIRCYAFAEKAGKLKRSQLNEALLRECQQEVAAAGEDQLKRARDSAYGTSFPDETKRARSAGWYFFSDPAFDLATACQLDFPEQNDLRPAMKAALISNLNYEEGCNPVNVTYLTGLGCKRQVEIVDQYAQNDRRSLPPTGIPLGNIQAGITWVYLYGKEPSELSFPSDSAEKGAYPFYDRWSDAFNLSQEFVILQQARGLGALAWLMAQTPLAGQAWRGTEARLTQQSSRDPKTGYMLELVAPGLDLSNARVAWEGSDLPVQLGGRSLTISRRHVWVEAEAQLPDGRRVFAVSRP